MRAVVFGYHSMGVLGFRALRRHGFEVAAVFTHSDRRGETIWWPSLAECAGDDGIPVNFHDSPKAADLPGLVRACSPDMIFSFYYRHLLAAPVLAQAPAGGVNLHGSLLPEGRGRAPVNWSLVHGDQRTGVSLHYMVERADAGALIDQEAVDIADWDTAFSLFGKLEGAALRVLDRSLPALRDGTATSRPLDLERGTYNGRRTPADGLIDWRWPAARIYNLVRAVTHPYPGAFSFWRGRQLRLWWALPEAGRTGEEPGTILSIGLDGVVVAAGEGAVRAVTVQLAGQPIQPAVSFANSHGIRPGDRLDSGNAMDSDIESEGRAKEKPPSDN